MMGRGDCNIRLDGGRGGLLRNRAAAVGWHGVFLLIFGGG